MDRIDTSSCPSRFYSWRLSLRHLLVFRYFSRVNFLSLSLPNPLLNTYLIHHTGHFLPIGEFRLHQWLEQIVLRVTQFVQRTLLDSHLAIFAFHLNYRTHIGPSLLNFIRFKSTCVDSKRAGLQWHTRPGVLRHRPSAVEGCCHDLQIVSISHDSLPWELIHIVFPLPLSLDLWQTFGVSLTAFTLFCFDWSSGLDSIVQRSTQH